MVSYLIDGTAIGAKSCSFRSGQSMSPPGSQDQNVCLQALQLCQGKKPKTVDTAVQRRQRLVRRIDQQISLIKSADHGVMPRASWVWMDEKGGYFLPINYGRSAIELKKRLFAIRWDSVEGVATALATLRDMVLNGEVDAQIAAASNDIRSRFKFSKTVQNG